jgi:predicted GIY-YIG superfamily endonuclease
MLKRIGYIRNVSLKGWMYILECSDGTYYTGSTINLNKRLLERKVEKEQIIQKIDSQ